MRIFNFKKGGFTLSELAIAVLIVGLLVLALVPVLRNQMKKSDAYSYYLAFKTVEKLGSQIVAVPYNESGTTTSYVEPKIKIALKSKENVKYSPKPVEVKNNYHKLVLHKTPYMTIVNRKLRLANESMYSVLYPAAYAITPSDYDNSYTLFSSNELDHIEYLIALCVKNVPYPKSINADGTEVWMTDADKKDECYPPISYKSVVGSDGNITTVPDESAGRDNYTRIINSNIEALYSASTCTKDVSGFYSYFYNLVPTNYKDFHDFSEESQFTGACSKVASNCIKETSYYKYFGPSIGVFHDVIYDSGEDGSDTTYALECQIYEKIKPSQYDYSQKVTDFTPAALSSNACGPAMGYYGMENSSGNVYVMQCTCKSGYVESENNSHVCCTGTLADGYAWYAKSSGSNRCISCSYGAFNPTTNTCCGANQYYDEAEEKCKCNSGYEMSGNVCVRSRCSKGMYFDENTKVCVPAAPIVKAHTFCELIKDNWNIKDSNCNVLSGNSVYSSVYSAALGTNNVLNSITANNRSGAFANITPNIVFSNGLKLWILGDRYASIPGLTFDPSNSTKTKGVCTDHTYSEGKTTREKCNGTNEYFCEGENRCVSVDAATKSALGDARNCCGSPNLSDITSTNDPRHYAISGFTVYVDINGDSRGSGTLWEDVFPFYVGVNGKVFPAYPLDAKKAKNAGSDSLSLFIGGNSDTYMASDVYWYSTSTNSMQRTFVSGGQNVSYAKALCLSNAIYQLKAPYCLNLGGTGTLNTICNDVNEPKKCFVSLRQRRLFF